MATICPTVLAGDAHDYQKQMARIASFTRRVQIDLTDGVFAASPTVALEQAWWPEGIEADLHLMYKEPAEYLKEIDRLKPHLVIIHAEADGNFIKIADHLKHHDIKVGVALLPKTSTHVIKPSLEMIDHILIFSGDLGKFGGIADPALLKKVKQLKEWKPEIEVGWDGGVNNENASDLARGGVDVLNVGGYIQNAAEPGRAYEELLKCLA